MKADPMVIKIDLGKRKEGVPLVETPFEIELNFAHVSDAWESPAEKGIYLQTNGMHPHQGALEFWADSNPNTALIRKALGTNLKQHSPE